MKSSMLTLLAVTGLAALPCAAQNMKPGLWEMSNKMHSSDGKLENTMSKLQEQMASMPPEQRKMMEDMMAKRGMSMTGGPGGAMSVKMCITKEMVAQGQMPMQQQGDCKTTRTPPVGGKVHMVFKCSNPPSSGEGDMMFSSDGAYTMKMKIEHAQGGKPETMNMEGTGKWLSADCGAIKPIAMPPSK